MNDAQAIQHVEHMLRARPQLGVVLNHRLTGIQRIATQQTARREQTLAALREHRRLIDFLASGRQIRAVDAEHLVPCLAKFALLELSISEADAFIL